MLVVRGTFRKVAQLTRTYPAKDRILAVSEPVALVVLLVTWLVMTMFGFTLVNWGIGTGSFPTAFSEAGSSVFTLGFTLTHTQGSRTVDFVAAGTGMVLVALQIAYLPTLYAAYNRRETLVTLLESRAGSPAWGPELLIRHQLVGTIDNLANLFAEWERWAADVAESHSTYPSLLYLRSPRALNSWIVSLIAVLDAAALTLAMDPVGAPIEARMCIRMGFTCLRDIAQATRIPFDPDPSPDQSHRPRRGGLRRGLRPTGGRGTADVAAQARGVGPLPGLAGQLRVGGLRRGLPARRATGQVDRPPPPDPGGVVGAVAPDRPPAHVGPAGGRSDRPRGGAPPGRPSALTQAVADGTHGACCPVASRWPSWLRPRSCPSDGGDRAHG